jgi:hypothetical protein
VKPIYVIGAIIIVVALVVSVPVFNSTTEDFSTYNAQWNGCSRIKDLSASPQDRPVSSAFSLEGLGAENRGVLVMLNPSDNVNMTQSDIANVKAFVQNGGSLLLAADFGNANPVLDGLGLGDTVRFNQSLLVDAMSNWGGSAFPEISFFSPSNVTTDVQHVYFDYGTVLDINGTSYPSNIAVLARSGPSSYLIATPADIGTPQNGSSATTGEKPVLAYLGYGNGKIMLLSDPSVFVNGMLDKGDNAKLYENIIANLTNGDTTAPIIFDESHYVQQPLWSAGYGDIMSSDATKFIFVLGATGLFVLGVVASRRRQKTEQQRPDVVEVPLDEATIMGLIAERHPRWSRLRLRELFNNLRLPQQRRRP